MAHDGFYPCFEKDCIPSFRISPLPPPTTPPSSDIPPHLSGDGGISLLIVDKNCLPPMAGDSLRRFRRVHVPLKVAPPSSLPPVAVFPLLHHFVPSQGHTEFIDIKSNFNRFEATED